MIVGFIVAMTFCAGATASGDAIPADLPPDFMPLGAYLSWERIGACANFRGMDRWEDVNRRLDILQANHVNLLWVTNMSEADLPRLAEECAKRSIRLLPCIDAVEAKVDWRWAANGEYYDTLLPRIVNETSNAKSIAGWVLSDEPVEKDFPRLETLRLKLRELDPTRFCTAVFMWPQAPLAPKQIKFPVVCVDLYPFFGPDDPNGPHTDAASKAFFRGHAKSMMDAIGAQPVAGWIMGMCFSDIWGPRKYTDNGHLIGLPGAYLHWRAPTLAEMRWQVWESIRSGAKGFICYTLAPEAPDPQTATAPSPDVAWKNVLAKSETDLGPNALTNPDGTATPQLEELGRVYAQLAPHTDLIVRWQTQTNPSITAEGDGQLQCFIDPKDNSLYTVVLNDDLHEAHTLKLQLKKAISAIKDVVRNQEISLDVKSPEGLTTGSIHLDAGEGVILHLHP